MINVAFPLNPTNWTGGKNYFANLFSALRALPHPLCEPLIFTGLKSVQQMRADFPGIKVIEVTSMDRGTVVWGLREATLRMGMRDFTLQRLLDKYEVSVLSHLYSHRVANGSALPAIGWIADFQHVHLPNFFTDRERQRRDDAFLKLCTECQTIIVSSEAAKADLANFAPRQANKAVVLRFVANPVNLPSVPPLSVLQAKYGFNEPYFILPNQFHAHKNHRLVISALRILKEKNQSLLVIATGRTRDEGNPSFYPELMNWVNECNVGDRFSSLGVIPFGDLVGLMTHSLAFINPSRFEGWSTSVEEAKSMGKHILLSDIPVHREQSPKLASYFHQDDADGLASSLWMQFQNFDRDIDLLNQSTALAEFPERQRRFAETYQAIVQTTIRNKDLPAA